MPTSSTSVFAARWRIRDCRDNLTAFQQGWRTARDRAADEIDFPTLQSRMKRAKSAVTADLEAYLEEFRLAAEAAGATVHTASDAAAANRIILEIARRHDVSLIAKSKSMVSEEIGFNHVAEDAGYRVVETDLGEWIVQLRHERPSHMVMPAVHLSRQEIGDGHVDSVGARSSPARTSRPRWARHAMRSATRFSRPGWASPAPTR